MARTTTKPDLAGLEQQHEAFNEQRGELAARRRKLGDRLAAGEAVNRELRKVEREIDDVEAEHEKIMPALQDARTAQSDAIRHAGRIDTLEREIAVYQDLIAFSDALRTLAEQHLAPHLNAWGRPTGPVPQRLADLGRDVLTGPLSGSDGDTVVQVRNQLGRARRELVELRGNGGRK